MIRKDLKSEVERLTEENERLRADLRAERGEQIPGEIVVRRWGTELTAPSTFHVRTTVDLREVSREGACVLDFLLERTREMLLTEFRAYEAAKEKAANAA